MDGLLTSTLKLEGLEDTLWVVMPMMMEMMMKLVIIFAVQLTVNRDKFL